MLKRLIGTVLLLIILSIGVFWILLSVVSLSKVFEVFVFTQYRQEWDLGQLPDSIFVLGVDLVILTLLVIRYLRKRLNKVGN